jgi:hypothetical protein
MSNDGPPLRNTIHDLNNVLTRIIASAELIASQAVDEQSVRDAQDICESALAGRELVADVCRSMETLELL